MSDSPPPLILHAAAQENHPESPDDPIHREVCRKIERCDEVQDQIIEGTRITLEKEGIIITDPKDITKAVDIVLTDHQGDIDERLSKFTRFRGSLGRGTKNDLLPDIMKVLRDFGNNNVPDPDQ